MFNLFRKGHEGIRIKSAPSVHGKKFNIILDLDNSILSSLSPDEVPTDFTPNFDYTEMYDDDGENDVQLVDESNVILRNLSKSQLSTVKDFVKDTFSVKKSQTSRSNRELQFRVYHRPYLQDFLDYIFENYNVAVFTAASKDYAAFIIDKIILVKPDRKLDFIFFSYHTDISRKYYNSPKNLKVLWDVFKIRGYRENNTIIIDDLDEVYNGNNNKNVIRAPYFDAADKNCRTDAFLSNKHVIPLIEYKKNLL